MDTAEKVALKTVADWKTYLQEQADQLDSDKIHDLKIEFYETFPKSFFAHIELARSYFRKDQSEKALEILASTENINGMTKFRQFANDRLKFECLNAIGDKTGALKLIDECLVDPLYSSDKLMSQKWLTKGCRISTELGLEEKCKTYSQQLKTYGVGFLPDDIVKYLSSFDTDAPQEGHYARLAWSLSGHTGPIDKDWLKRQNWGVRAREIFKSCAFLPVDDPRAHIFTKFVKKFDLSKFKKYLNEGNGVIVTGPHIGLIPFIFYFLKEEYSDFQILSGHGVIDKTLDISQSGSDFRLARQLIKALKQGQIIAILSDVSRDAKDKQVIELDGYSIDYDGFPAKVALKSGAALIWAEAVWENREVSLYTRKISIPKSLKSAEEVEAWWKETVIKKMRDFHKNYEPENFNMPAGYARPLA